MLSLLDKFEQFFDTSIAFSINTQLVIIIFHFIDHFIFMYSNRVNNTFSNNLIYNVPCVDENKTDLICI